MQPTKRIQGFKKGLLAAVSAGFLFLSLNLTALAAMDPAEIKRINQEAPYHLIGSVEEDVLLKDLSDSASTPSQLRKMTLEIIEINRVPHNEPLRSVEISYTYIPPWVERDGGTGMDIAVDDVIEIWLKDGEFGLEPAAWGNSIHHLYYAPDRPEHIPEPLGSKARHAGKAFLTNPHTVGNAVVLSGFAALFIILAVVGIRRRRFTNKKSAV